MALKDLNRREFLAPAAAGLAFTIVPRHVLGGQGYVAPSDKLTLAYVGCGTQGCREMLQLLPNTNVQITSVCDPVKDGEFYIDWDKWGLRNSIRTALGNPTWGSNIKGIRAGRDMFHEIITTSYAQKRGTETYKGCNVYEDWRELLSKEKDLDAVKIMTPDHHHARIAMAAMRAGKHVAVHKPLSNKVSEVRMIVDTVKKTGKQTHLLAYRPPVTAVADMVKDGAIGTLREIHNWTDRPFWPQQLRLPTDRPPVPQGLNWDLWLGGSTDRPYSPVYTFAVFRGWYEFGGGSIADMGNYSLWPIFTAFDLPVPYSIEAQGSSSCQIDDGVSTITANDYAYPYANRIKYKIAAHGNWPEIALYWYDGGIRPFTIPELEEDKISMPATGSLFVGDKGVILNNNIVPAKKNAEYRAAKGLPAVAAGRGGRGGGGGGGGEGGATGLWVSAFKGGPASPGNFLSAANCAEAIALGAAAMRISRKNFGENKAVPALQWDAANMRFTNNAEANQYLVREYRPGWELS